MSCRVYVFTIQEFDYPRFESISLVELKEVDGSREENGLACAK